jgi:hypothetical protein
MHLPLFFEPFPVFFCPLFCQVLLLFFGVFLMLHPCPFLSCFLADVSHFRSCVLSVFSDILCGISLQTRTRPMLVQHIFDVRYSTCSLPPDTFGPQEPVIFENRTRDSRAQPVLEDRCCHRRRGLRLDTPLAALAGTTLIKNTLDQLSLLMWAKAAGGPTVTL